MTMVRTVIVDLAVRIALDEMLTRVAEHCEFNRDETVDFIALRLNGATPLAGNRDKFASDMERRQR